MPRLKVYEVFIKIRNADGSANKFGRSHIWNTSSFAEAERKSLEIMTESEFIWKITVDY
jgi:hypothetical protein